jgi:hypothetical protein
MLIEPANQAASQQLPGREMGGQIFRIVHDGKIANFWPSKAIGNMS